jgi:hypothetical protein
MDTITIDKNWLQDEIINPLARIYGELEDIVGGLSVEELEVVITKLNEELKKSL